MTTDIVIYFLAADIFGKVCFGAYILHLIYRREHADQQIGALRRRVQEVEIEKKLSDITDHELNALLEHDLGGPTRSTK